MLHTMLDCELDLIRSRWPAAKEKKVNFNEFLRNLYETLEISRWTLLNITQEDAENH